MGSPISKQPCKKGFPCAVCGKEDHCFSAVFEDGPLWFCSTYTDDEVSNGGQTFILKGITSQQYARYEEKEQFEANRQRWIELQERTNPNWISRKRSASKRPQVKVPEIIETQRKVIDYIEPLSNERLHAIYSFMLDQLVLEDNHKKALLDEWNAGIEPDLGDRLLATWPIRSLPMGDRARKVGEYNLKNITRRELISRMVEKFGSLRGVPGFYLETSKWTDRNGIERTDTHWQMVGLSGIIYPEYDAKGNIYRIRIGDEHVSIREYARDKDGSYIYHTVAGKEKHLTSASYEYDYYSGEWYRIPYVDNKPRKDLKKVVYSNQKHVYDVQLNTKGYPVVDGKPDGKYKNFSSRAEATNEKIVEDENGKKIKQITVFNRYAEGTQSGSNISLYSKPNDDFRYLFVTEGEKKAVVMNMLLNCPVVSLPGVQTYPKLFEKEYLSNLSLIESLKEKGLIAIIIVYDADKATNDMVLNCEKGAVQSCLDKGIQTFLGEWNINFGKGADDILIQGLDLNYTKVTT